MLCQRCQKKIANVYFTKVINGKKTEIYLCEQCAGEQGYIGFVSPVNIGSFLSELVGKNVDPGTESKPDTLACAQCGMRYDEFQQTGKLGCGNCYKTFEEQLKPVLKRLHGNHIHCGKTPEGWAEKSERTLKAKEGSNPQKTMKKTVPDRAEGRQRKTDQLKILLNEAIQKEEYEKAAQLRDRIRDIERSGAAGDTGKAE